MTREEREIIEAIESMGYDRTAYPREKVSAVISMSIEALKQPSNATQLLNDGTLKVRVANVLDIKRIMVMGDNVIYDSYYPDRPKGEWIDSKTAKGYVVCSNCNKLTTNINRKKYDYCPFCGADMRGGTDD